MRKHVKSILLSFLMLLFSLSIATNSLNDELRSQSFEEIVEPLNVILPVTELNVPGFQEGSIFSDTTQSNGMSHSCAIIDNGSVVCWGYGSTGQLGNGNTTNSATPVLVHSLGNGRTAIAISAGAEHTCAILDNGSVSCWGSGYEGRLGNGDSLTKLTPTLTSSLGIGRTAVAISAGDYHTCVILDNGSVSCWGRNPSGQLGNGGNTVKNAPTLTSSLGSGRTAIAISAGEEHTCVILDSGSVSCWGWGYYGQLGNGANNLGVYSPSPPINLGVSRTAVALDAGTRHTCAILDNGSVSCWGINYYGQLGNGESGQSADKNVPTLTASLGLGRTAIAIASGQHHSCAVLDNGSVSCWGKDNGKLGRGWAEDSSFPVLTSSLGIGRNATSVSVGTGHTCVVLDNASTSCWGANNNGQLGDQTNSGSVYPNLVSSFGLNRSTALSERDFDGDATLNIFESPLPSVVNCNPGMYGRYVCVDAPIGKYAPINGSMYPTDASPGYYVNSTGQSSPTPCPMGKYNPNYNSISVVDCLNASVGHYVSSIDQSNQTVCPAGTFQPNTGSSSCFDASVGHFVNWTFGMGQTNQSPCPSGKYNPENGSTSEDDCRWADRGHYVNYSYGPGQFSQTPCPIGTYSPFDTATSLDTCLLAIPGTFANQTGLEMLYICPKGTFQPESGQQSCIPADPGHRPQHDEEGWASSQVPCSPGQYQPLSGQFDCLNTDVGHFTNQTGSIAQTPCLPGTYQIEIGSSNCVKSNPGHSVVSEGQSNQSVCLTGTYQPLSGQNFCLSADKGHYVISSLVNGTMLNLNQIECPKGTFQHLTKQDFCFEAEPGHYVNLTGQYNQLPCPKGTYQPGTRQHSCILSEAGTYVNETGQTSVLDCPEGTFNPSNGAFDISQCLGANQGYFVALEGQISQTPCEIGTFQNLTKMNFCNDASIGSYVSEIGSMSQTTCPTYTSTLIPKSTSIEDCLLDTDLDGNPNLIDPDDDNDGIIDELDVFPLDDSDHKDTDGNGVGDNAQAQLESEEKTESKRSLIVIVGLVSVLVCGLAMMKRKKNSSSNLETEPPSLHNTSLNHNEKPIGILNPNPSPSIDQVGVIGGDGYEWINFPPNSQTNFYRAPGDKEWILWEN